MLAAVLTEPGKVELQEREIPSPGPGEILLAVEATTMCGTDLRIIAGTKTSGVRPGVIMGHEIAGRIAEIGEGVTGYEVGRQATVSIVVSCGTCADCLNDREHLCAQLELFGYAIDGGFAEYILVPAHAVARGNVIQTDAEIPPTALALSEPISCCLNAHAQYDVQPGNTVVVLGAGPIGLLHIQLAKASGAGQIIATNRGAERRALAEKLGATLTIDPSETDTVAAVKEATGGRGADVVIVCIGVPELANQALELATNGGRVSYFAGFPKDSTAEVEVNLIHYNELVVTGGSNARRRDVARAIKMLEAGLIDHEAIVTQTFDLSDFDAARQAVEDRSGVKVAITPGGKVPLER